MSSESETLLVMDLKPEEKILHVATNKEITDWKAFLYDLINSQGLDPWDIDIGLLTRNYLVSIKQLSSLDFDLTGKLLTIAVFLLKTKAELLVEKDLRGIEQRITEALDQNNLSGDLETLEGFDSQLDLISQGQNAQKEKYVLRFRNPLARKRKVTIFDLIRALEKTFEQSNKRRLNFLQRKGDSDKYTGPIYEKKSKDLKTIIEELYNFVLGNYLSKEALISFNKLVFGVNHRAGILEKFIPLLHLHNQNKLLLSQNEHLGDIMIQRAEEED